MKKSEILAESIKKIDLAVQQGLGLRDWEPISLLSGGTTGIPVYQIEVNNNSYAIKLEDVNDKNFDLSRSYQILEAVSEQGISPTVYFTDAQHGIILMKYVESKSRPEASPEWIKKLASTIRNLHDNNSFTEWKSVLEILDYFYLKLPAEYMEKSIVKKCMHQVSRMKDFIFNKNDLRSCHGDLNPVNVLFDGKDYLLVDWQGASPQSLYFDLAYCASWFYFYSEELCASFLSCYFDREPTEEEKAKYYLMRVFTNIYSGIAFISKPFQNNKNVELLSDEEIGKLPSYQKFMQAVGSGKINLSDSDAQLKFGFAILKIGVEAMMNHRYEKSYEVLDKKNNNLKNVATYQSSFFDNNSNQQNSETTDIGHIKKDILCIQK